MNCEKCGRENMPVMNSRQIDGAWHRVRICACGNRIETKEVLSPWPEGVNTSGKPRAEPRPRGVTRQKIAAMIDEEGSIFGQDIAERLKLTNKTVQNTLLQMKDKYTWTKVGQRKMWHKIGHTPQGYEPPKPVEYEPCEVCGCTKRKSSLTRVDVGVFVRTCSHFCREKAFKKYKGN